MDFRCNSSNSTRNDRKKKVDWYHESHFELTKELDRLGNEWRREQIIERGKKLAERALQILKRPSEI